MNRRRTPNSSIDQRNVLQPRGASFCSFFEDSKAPSLLVVFLLRFLSMERSRSVAEITPSVCAT